MSDFSELTKLLERVAELEAALKPFADEASVPPMPGEPSDPRRCSMTFLKLAKTVMDRGDQSPECYARRMEKFKQMLAELEKGE